MASEKAHGHGWPLVLAGVSSSLPCDPSSSRISLGGGFSCKIVWTSRGAWTLEKKEKVFVRRAERAPGEREREKASDVSQPHHGHGIRHSGIFYLVGVTSPAHRQWEGMTKGHGHQEGAMGPVLEASGHSNPSSKVTWTPVVLEGY